MAKINWTNGSGGDFANASNWSTDAVPMSTSIANINAAGTYTVTSEADETVLAVTTASTATLDVTNGLFAALAGTGLGANAGTIKLEGPGTFLAGGTFNNKGTIAVSGADGGWILLRDTTVAGGGSLSLSDSFLLDRANTLTFTNVDNTISGTGSIYVMQLVNEARGVIDANGTDPLSITTWTGTPGTVVNTGTLEATGQGGLGINDNIKNVGGVIEAVGIGSVVHLEAGSTITGGTFQTADGGVIQAEGGNNSRPSPGASLTLDGTNGNTLTNAGILSIPNNDWLNLRGASKIPARLK
jgi:hypothetical protein